MDSILLQNISVRTHIGVPEVERRNTQILLVTIELFVPLQATAKIDDITKSIDYAAVTDEVLRLAKTERKTIEKFAEDTAESILERFKPTGGVRITVMKKPDLPLESASVTIHRP